MSLSGGVNISRRGDKGMDAHVLQRFGLAIGVENFWNTDVLGGLPVIAQDGVAHAEGLKHIVA